MRKGIAIVALALTASTAAMAQSGGSSSGTGGGVSAGQGTTGTPGRLERLPGTTERSKAAPGSSGRAGATAGRPRPNLPSGPSAAGEIRRGSAAVDLNSNSATGMPPPSSTGSGAMDRPPRLPLGPGTGAVDTKVPDSSVYNPGLQR